tara:strand:+ start:773 stop:982 length:210 start_codon:yes stop_codon:yes gene_type:complete
MKALLYTVDEDTPDGFYVKFDFDENEIKGCYRPEDAEGCYNVLLSGIFLTLVETPELREFLSIKFNRND